MSTVLDPRPLLALKGRRTDAEFARLIGVDRRTVARWRRGRSRSLNDVTAERAAVALGRHPSELWPGVTLDGDWQDRAVCRHADPRWFFTPPPGPEREGREAGWFKERALETCARCPVAAECLDWVLRSVRSGDDYGIWSGTTRNERAKLRRELGLS